MVEGAGPVEDLSIELDPRERPLVALGPAEDARVLAVVIGPGVLERHRTHRGARGEGAHQAQKAGHRQLGVHAIGPQRRPRKAEEKGRHVALLVEGDRGVVREHRLELEDELDPVAQRRSVHDEVGDEVERGLAGPLSDVEPERLVAGQVERARLDVGEHAEFDASVRLVELRGADARPREQLVAVDPGLLDDLGEGTQHDDRDAHEYLGKS